MKIEETEFEGLYEILPEIHGDHRGFFLETFRNDLLVEKGLDSDFVQDNQSFSRKNILRGLHLQLPPHQQTKLVRAVTGKVLDVVVDMRVGSPTFLKHFSRVLDSEKSNMLYIPGGFAHGISILEDAIFSYKCSAYYNKDYESGVRFDDPALNIDWELDNPILSEKDKLLPSLQEFLKTYELA